MGGVGSGGVSRWRSRITTDEVRRIDIRLLNKLGVISRLGYIGILCWSCNGKSAGYIGYRVAKNALILLYRVHSSGRDCEHVEEAIRFDKTPCNYGGERTWLLCPRCSKRVAVLYGAGFRFLCRHCYGLPYASQNETYIERMMRKARKIRRRLNASKDLTDPVLKKPEGMHWKTFERLRREEEVANEAYTGAFREKLKAYGLQDML